MKNFYSAQDIEDLAAQGKAELILDEDGVLTDLARHMAEQLGIRVIQRSRLVPVSAPLPAVAAPARSVVSGLGIQGKPKGCQHEPLTDQRPAAVEVSATSNTVVDQLVGLVKRLGSRGSGT